MEICSTEINLHIERGFLWTPFKKKLDRVPSEHKEVFQLFDKDEDLSFIELRVIMRSLGQLPTGKQNDKKTFLIWL